MCPLLVVAYAIAGTVDIDLSLPPRSTDFASQNPKWNRSLVRPDRF
jgi:aconitase A